MTVLCGVPASALLLCLCALVSAEKTPLYIQGFVPTHNPTFRSESIIPAATVAVKEINDNPNVLPNYTLVVEWNSTLCDPSEATWQLIRSVLNGTNETTGETIVNPFKIMFLGGGCSLATEPLAALSGRFYNVTQLSYGASTPALSDTNMFPRFYRTIPSEVQANSARFALMKQFGWERVATLHETQNIFSRTVDDFHMRYDDIYQPDEDDDEETLILRSFTDDPEIPLRQIKEKDIRIIMGYMYEDKARPTICKASRMELTTENHVWMFPAWYESEWWLQNDTNVDCTDDEMSEAIENAFYVESYNFGRDPNATTFSGATNASFYEKYLEEFAEFRESHPLRDDNDVPHNYVPFTYDAIYAMALALHATEEELRAGGNITLANFTYADSTITDLIFKHLNNTNFTGISGVVRFDEDGTRIGLNAIYQLRRNEDDRLIPELLAINDPADDPEDGVEFMLDPIWRTSTGIPPSDRRTPMYNYLDRDLIITCGVFTGLAIITAIALIVFNIVTIQKPLIRDSAPFINLIIILGCILMLATCYLLGIDSATPPIDNRLNDDQDTLDQSVIDNRNSRYGAICTWRLWLLTIGFTLSFGALFAKTWQVYRVYTNPKLKKEPFKMWNFLIILGILLFIDVLYLSIWSGVFPFRRETKDDNDNAQDKVFIFEKCECDNFGYLIGALYVYKGLLVVFGLFLAYESRNVKYLYINDSRFVSIAMYIVVIMVGIGAPLSLVLAVHFFINPAYGLAVFMIIISCMSCLLILHIPKFIYMWKGLDTMVKENTREEVTVSDGLQLGRSTVDQSDIQTAEDDVNDLKKKLAEKDMELKKLEGDGTGTRQILTGPKPRSGSDGDSGVLVTGDETENEIYSTESTTNEEAQQSGSGSSSSPATPPTPSELHSNRNGNNSNATVIANEEDKQEFESQEDSDDGTDM